MKNYLNKNWPLLVLPLVMILFIILIFYILGGATAPANEKKEVVQTKKKAGINYNLPQADRTIGIVDKMEAVQAQTEKVATQDYSIEGENSDAQISFEKDSLQSQERTETVNTDGAKTAAEGSNADEVIPDHLMEHIREQEALVKQEMRTAAGDSVADNGSEKMGTDPSGSEDLNGKYPEFRALRETGKKNTSGIEELDELFDRNRALARQNDSLNFRLQEANQGNTKTIPEAETKGFTLEKAVDRNTGKATGDPFAGAIRAEIYETTTVLTGNRVKLRLLEDTRLSGVEIPRNTFVYGICRTDNERLQIEVQQIPYGGHFLPVKITVCDLDGMPGIYVPDQAARKITREVGTGVNTSSMVGFTGNPLAYAGVQAADRAARTVMQVIKQKKVTIKKNTLVYLINKNK